MRVVVVLVLMSACADDEICVDAYRQLIAQGVYGQMTYFSDVVTKDRRPVPIPNEKLVVRHPNGDLFGFVTTDTFGVYATEMPVGEFQLCLVNAFEPETCGVFTVPQDDTIRLDVFTAFGPTNFVPSEPKPCE